MGDSGTDLLTLPLTPPLLPALGVMPRPGQPGAMQFDGKNITEFLEEWNIECEDFGIDKVKRCARFPNYCVRAIKDTIKLLPGYIAEDWDVLQTDVKKLYWPHDKPKNTMTALAELVKEAHTYGSQCLRPQIYFNFRNLGYCTCPFDSRSCHSAFRWIVR